MTYIKDWLLYSAKAVAAALIPVVVQLLNELAEVASAWVLAGITSVVGAIVVWLTRNGPAPQ